MNQNLEAPALHKNGFNKIDPAPLTPDQQKVLHRELRNVFQKLNRPPFNFAAADINAIALGLVTKSMEAIVGEKEARSWIESALDNVWGKKSIIKRITGR